MAEPSRPSAQTCPGGSGRGPTRPGLGGAILRRLPLVGTALGLMLGLWLIATNDLSAIGAAFGRIGWAGLAGIVLVRAGLITLCGLAWACILTGLAQVETGAFLMLRFVREGINTLLPVASVGGEVVGGRLLTFWGVSGALAAASLLVDMLIQVGTQVAFTLGGVALLRQMEGEAAAALARWTLNAAIVALVLLAAFFCLQRLGTARLAERGLALLRRQFARRVRAGFEAGADGPTPPRVPTGVQDALDAIWARRRWGRIALAVLLHLGAWVLGAAEVGLALACMGVSAGIGAVLVLESLSQAVKSAAFPVPSGLGVQEGGFVLVGALFGLDAGTAIALSLVKRVPDAALGLPSLVAWQVLEARRATVLPAPGR